MNARLPTIILLASSALGAAVLTACGGGGAASVPTVTMGTLGVSMTDAPACGFDAVNVTVNKIRVHQSATASDADAGWTDITLSPSKKINLLNLTNGALETLGQTSLAAGHYTQMRLVLDPNTGNGLANSVISTGSTVETSLTTPSALQSGIKLVNEFDVASGQRVDLVLDFNACKSVVTTGNGKYMLKPVVKVIPTAINGIDGFVNTTLLSSHVVVSAQQNGVIVSSTTPNATTGEFFLSRIAPGSYDVVITADDHATSVIAAVPVASTATTTALNTSVAPLSMATSAMGSIGGIIALTPPSTTEVAFISAKQTFPSGPTVIVKYKGADLTTGAYIIGKLPTAAPQFATYSATAPLVFTANTTTTPGTGKYIVEASATGYKTVTLPLVDISATSQTAINFALVP